MFFKMSETRCSSLGVGMQFMRWNSIGHILLFPDSAPTGIIVPPFSNHSSRSHQKQFLRSNLSKCHLLLSDLVGGSLPKGSGKHCWKTAIPALVFWPPPSQALNPGMLHTGLCFGAFWPSCYCLSGSSPWNAFLPSVT